MKLRIRKMGMLWWLWIVPEKREDIPELLGQFAYYPDAFARVQVEITPWMREECDRKQKAHK